VFNAGLRAAPIDEQFPFDIVIDFCSDCMQHFQNGYEKVQNSYEMIFIGILTVIAQMDLSILSEIIGHSDLMTPCQTSDESFPLFKAEKNAAPIDIPNRSGLCFSRLWKPWRFSSSETKCPINNLGKDHQTLSVRLC
jgi:hypothetical protein